MQGAGGEGCEGGKVYFPKNTRKVFMLHAQEYEECIIGEWMVGATPT